MNHYGDDKLLRAFPLAVVAQARRMLDELWAEDDFARPPRQRRVFTAAELEETYDRAEDIVSGRRRGNAPGEDWTPMGAVAAEIREQGERILAAMKQLACGGAIRPDRENGIGGVDACTPDVERACGKRNEPSCPREIMRFEQLIERSKRGDRPPPKPVLKKSDRERLVDCGVPEDIADQLLFKPFDDQLEPVQYVRSWVHEDDKPYLVLAGVVGNGKSTAAAWALKALDYDGLWVTCWGLELAARLKDEKLIKSWVATPLLVIDELGTEDLSDAVKSLMVRLAYSRGKKKTLYTTNMPTREVMCDRYTERFQSRVLGDGRAERVKGESMRGKRRKKGD